jgi:hypothetical protein
MKANDLRVGNTLKSHLTGEYVKVDWLAIKHIQDGNIQSIYNPEVPVYEPIPLTPEILEKCGFKLLSFANGVKYISLPKLPKPFVLLFVRDHYILSIKQDSFPELIDMQTRGSKLHQLQNLYYALTGEEFKINLSETVKP